MTRHGHESVEAAMVGTGRRHHSSALACSSRAVEQRATRAAGRTLPPAHTAVGPATTWLLPLSGGEARRLSDISIDNTRLWLSRDGREVIFATREGTRICAFPTFDPCRAAKVIAGPLSADGKTVLAIDRNDPRNIVAQPVDGSTPTPLTRFTDKETFDLSLSPDGKQLAITRISRVSDVVLIKGLK